MSSAILLFMARVLVLLLLYVFLYLVVQALRRDLRATARRAQPASPGPYDGKPSFTRGMKAAASGGQHALRLELLDAGQTPLSLGQSFSLRNPLLIGRAATSDIALEDDWVSAQHVRLRRVNGAWLAEDLGSTNGTRINGQPVHGAAVPVGPGDVLDLGRVKFKVVENLPASTPP